MSRRLQPGTEDDVPEERASSEARVWDRLAGRYDGIVKLFALINQIARHRPHIFVRIAAAHNQQDFQILIIKAKYSTID